MKQQGFSILLFLRNTFIVSLCPKAEICIADSDDRYGHTYNL